VCNWLDSIYLPKSHEGYKKSRRLGEKFWREILEYVNTLFKLDEGNSPFPLPEVKEMVALDSPENLISETLIAWRTQGISMRYLKSQLQYLLLDIGQIK